MCRNEGRNVLWCTRPQIISYPANKIRNETGIIALEWRTNVVITLFYAVCWSKIRKFEMIILPLIWYFCSFGEKNQANCEDCLMCVMQSTSLYIMDPSRFIRNCMGHNGSVYLIAAKCHHKQRNKCHQHAPSPVYFTMPTEHKKKERKQHDGLTIANARCVIQFSILSIHLVISQSEHWSMR